MKKIMSIAAVTLMVVGLTACSCKTKSQCCSGEGEAAEKACPEGCTKPCCAKPAE